MDADVLEREFDINDPSTWPPPPAPEPPFDDVFVRRFVAVAAHVRRFLPQYLALTAWAALMVLVDPFGAGGERPGPLAASGPRVGARPVASTGGAATAPVFEDGLGPARDPVTPAGDVGDFSYGPEPGGGAFEGGAPYGAVEGSFTFDDATGGTDLTSDAGPTPLSIVEAGYASVAGGTPFEVEPPNGGLPVTVSGGQELRRSYVRLAGETTRLTLKPASDPGSTEADDLASIRLCTVARADWTPARKQPMSAAPPVDMTACATGARTAAGLWVFDLSLFENPAIRNGFAIVPGSGTGSTFQVVFSPSAVPGGAA